MTIHGHPIVFPKTTIPPLVFNKPCSPEQMCDMLVLMHVKRPALFTKVAIMECGWEMESALAVAHHNFFGMRARPDFPSVGGHASYPDIEAGVNDLRLWQIQNERLDTITDDMEYLRATCYNPKPAYYYKLQTISWNDRILRN